MGSGTIICQGLYIWTKNDQSGRQKVRISNYLALVIARKSHAYFIIPPPPPPKKRKLKCLSSKPVRRVLYSGKYYIMDGAGSCKFYNKPFFQIVLKNMNS